MAINMGLMLSSMNELRLHPLLRCSRRILGLSRPGVPVPVSGLLITSPVHVCEAVHSLLKTKAIPVGTMRSDALLILWWCPMMVRSPTGPPLQLRRGAYRLMRLLMPAWRSVQRLPLLRLLRRGCQWTLLLLLHCRCWSLLRSPIWHSRVSRSSSTWGPSSVSRMPLLPDPSPPVM